MSHPLMRPAGSVGIDGQPDAAGLRRADAGIAAVLTGEAA